MVSATSMGTGEALQGTADAPMPSPESVLARAQDSPASSSPCCSHEMSEPLDLSVAQFSVCELGMTTWGCGVGTWSCWVMGSTLVPESWH